MCMVYIITEYTTNRIQNKQQMWNEPLRIEKRGECTNSKGTKEHQNWEGKNVINCTRLDGPTDNHSGVSSHEAH